MIISLFCRRLDVLSRDTTCCEDASNVSCLGMWDVIEGCGFRFSSCRRYLCEFVLVIMLDHLIVYVSTVRLEFFRGGERNLTRFFGVAGAWRSGSSSSTKATHQTWRERLIKLDRQHLVESDELYLIKSDEWCLIKLDEWYLIKLDEWYLIKLDEWYLIKSDKRYLIKLDGNFVCFLE